ncbi:hypothetical protein CCMA1212_003129 [Trichoderma ghanense]|uniref:Uncharacterized protein n=1 Tax=Trichoderma ghanense TaxID=65468 RepID=A0ABY2HBW1_9HYPO
MVEGHPGIPQIVASVDVDPHPHPWLPGDPHARVVAPDSPTADLLQQQSFVCGEVVTSGRAGERRIGSWAELRRSLLEKQLSAGSVQGQHQGHPEHQTNISLEPLKFPEASSVIGRLRQGPAEKAQGIPRISPPANRNPWKFLTRSRHASIRPRFPGFFVAISGLTGFNSVLTPPFSSP